MKFGTGFFMIILGLAAACSPKKKPQTSETGAAQALAEAPLPPPQNGSLAGTWRNCQSYPQGAIIGVKSSSIVYEFKDPQAMTMRADYYTDEQCQTKFTLGLAEAYFKEVEELSKTPVPEDVRTSVLSLTEGLSETVPYSASVVPAGDTGTLDLINASEPSYTSYKIWNNILHIASSCRSGDGDEVKCDPSGDSPTRRAAAFEDAETFERVSGQ